VIRVADLEHAQVPVGIYRLQPGPAEGGNRSSNGGNFDRDRLGYRLLNLVWYWYTGSSIKSGARKRPVAYGSYKYPYPPEGNAPGYPYPPLT
jgi:hypothetical protein